MSILSFPDRGKWGDKAWRGNCSGRVYLDLFNRFTPKVFVDPMVGSGTSIEAAKDESVKHLSIEAYGLDLHSGFNAISDSILDAVGKPADLCVSHPPYGQMITYSGEVWGSEPNPADLSRCVDDEDFHQKMQLVLLNQREAVKAGGIYGTIIGDYRRNGIYTSYQAEMICRMPRDELASVMLKVQHNTMSGKKSYGKMPFAFIEHEYILLWKKKEAPLLVLLGNLARDQYARLTGTWKSIVRMAMMSLGGKATLPELYAKIQEGAPSKLKENGNWKAKVRQTLQLYMDFSPVDRGVWQLAA